MTVITTLQGRGTFVNYNPQRAGGPAVVVSAPEWLGGGQFRFTIDSGPDAVLEVLRSTDLSAWPVIATATNSTGSMTYTDNSAPPAGAMYRVRQTSP
jgi:hypothetical protein